MPGLLARTQDWPSAVPPTPPQPLRRERIWVGSARPLTDHAQSASPRQGRDYAIPAHPHPCSCPSGPVCEKGPPWACLDRDGRWTPEAPTAWLAGPCGLESTDEPFVQGTMRAWGTHHGDTRAIGSHSLGRRLPCWVRCSDSTRPLKYAKK